MLRKQGVILAVVAFLFFGILTHASPGMAACEVGDLARGYWKPPAGSIWGTCPITGPIVEGSDSGYFFTYFTISGSYKLQEGTASNFWSESIPPPCSSINNAGPECVIGHEIDIASAFAAREQERCSEDPACKDIYTVSSNLVINRLQDGTEIYKRMCAGIQKAIYEWVCYDQCPNDPDKTEPGICGCGVPDIDSNGDGVPDCVYVNRNLGKNCPEQ